MGDQLTLLKDGTHGTHKNGDFAFLLSAKNIMQNSLFFDDTDRKISKADFDNIYANYQIQQDDVLLTIVGTIGRVALFPSTSIPIAFQRSVAILRAQPLLSQNFLALELQTQPIQSKLKARSNMSAQAGIYLGDLKKITVSVPQVQEQVKMASMLTDINNLIAATQHKIDAWEQAKKALLQRLFDQSWRFKGYSDPWEKRKLGETNSYFTDGNYGESYPKESELSDKENGVPFLRGSNLRNGELIEDNANYITKEKHAELTSGHLVEDDIVLAVRGSLGALGYVKDENIDWNINSQLAVIRTDKSELSGKFLVQFLLSWRGQKELLSRNTGTALKQLPIKQLKDVPVPIVNLDEQKEIGALFSSIDNLIAATQSRFSSLELLKKALLQDLFI